MRPISLVPIVVSTIITMVVAGCAGSRNTQPTYVIDPTVYTGPRSLADAGLGARPLAAVVGDDGILTRIISNEVLISGPDSEVAAFLTRHSGKVIGTLGPIPPV